MLQYCSKLFKWSGASPCVVVQEKEIQFCRQNYFDRFLSASSPTKQINGVFFKKGGYGEDDTILKLSLILGSTIQRFFSSNLP